MAHLSDDDVPTMTGTGSLVEELEDSGDTTSADLGAPVAAAIHAAVEAAAAEKAARDREAAEQHDEIDGHDAEDRTMSNAPSTVATGAGPPTHPSAVAPIPRGVALPSPTTVDDDELEDSVTTTAPRVPSSLGIPGSVLIRTVDDDMQDETEVKTLANLPPDLQRALKSARDQDPHAPQRSQPPPPPRPAAGVPARPATGPMPVSSVVATKPSRVEEPAATKIPQTEPLPAGIPTELDSDELAEDEDDDDVLPADEEGVTAQSLAPRVGSLPDSVVGPPSPLGPVPATPKDPPPTSCASSIDPETSKSTASEAVAAAMAAAAEADEPETRPGLGGDASATDDPPTRPGLVDPETRPGLGEPPTHPRSVDPRGSSHRVDVRPAAETDHDDSITAQAPNHASDLIAAAIATVTGRASDDDDDDDSTEGTTTKVKRSKLPAPPPAAGAPPPTSKEPLLPADEESESITTQAPGPLTNMLRVIAADRSSVPDGEAIEETEPEENRTAVMANAPLIRAAEEHQRQNGRSPLSVPTQLGLGPRGAAAPQLNPTSESGLRVARPGSGSGERMSVGAMGAAPSPVDPRISGIAPSARAGDGGPHGLAHANTELAFPQMPGAPPVHQPSMHDVPVGKGPSYGPLVAIVAIVSFVVPVTLFLALRGSDPEPKTGTPNEASSDMQKLDAPSRAKADKNKKSPDPAGSASAMPSASASSKGPNRFPFIRR